MTQLVRESEAMSEPPPDTMLMVESIVRAVARQGLEFEENMRRLRFMPFLPSPSPVSFLESSDPYHAFYLKKRDEYIAQLLDGTFVEPPPDNVYQPPLVDDFEPPPVRPQKIRGQPKPQPPPPLKDFSIPAEITLVELGVIKLTAQFVARYGKGFWEYLVNVVWSKPLFTFMKRQDSKFSFYNGLVLAYQRLLRPARRFPADVLDGFLQRLELDEKVIYFHAFVAGLDCFTHMDDHNGLLSASMPPSKPLSVPLDIPPLRRAENHHQYQDDGTTQPPTHLIIARITLKQLGVMKLTAQFVVRYGEHFRRELMMRVVTRPLFEFMFFRPDDPMPCTRPAEINFQVFSILVYVYSRVLFPCKKSRKEFDESVLECFFHRLQIEKLEGSDGDETAAVMDLNAFVAVVDYFAHLDFTHYSDYVPPPEPLTVMMNQPTHMHPGVLVQLSRGLVPRFYGRIRPWPVTLAAVTIPPQEELRVIKLTAQFMMRFGTSFELAVRKKKVPQLELIERWGSVFNRLCDVYSTILMPLSAEVKKHDDCIAVALEVFLHCLKNGVETSVVSFTNGVDYFASVDDATYSTVLPPPERLSVTLNRAWQMLNTYGSLVDGPKPTLRRRIWSVLSRYQGLVTPKELAVIKLTAVFVVRYGVRICRDLVKKAGIDMRPEFKFMEPADERFGLYKAVVDAYSKVLSVFVHADTETVLERYFCYLKWEKLETVDIDDLYGFVEGVDCFAQMEDDYYSGLMGDPLTQMPGMYCCPTLPLPEEPELKRQKLDESAEGDRCYAKIKVCIPVLNGRKVIEIRGDPLSEKVASLKEKIAGVIHIPVNKIKLSSGKAGFLKDDKSLAHNDVGPEEILTVRYRKRWEV